MILVPEWDRPPGPAGLDKGCRSGKPPNTRPARPKLSSGRLSCPLASETWGSSYRPSIGSREGPADAKGVVLVRGCRVDRADPGGSRGAAEPRRGEVVD